VPEEAEEKAEDVAEEAPAEPEEVAEGAEQVAEEAEEKPAEAEEVADDITKEGEEAVQEGEEAAEAAVPEEAEEVAEGETPKEGEELSDGQVPEGGEEAAEEATKEGEEVAQEGQEAAEGEVPEEAEEAAEEAQPELDFSVLEDGKVNKGGNVIGPDGNVVGHVTEGVIAKLIGKKVDAEGNIWNDSGKIIGKAEPVEQEKDEKDMAPFENFPDAIVDADGWVLTEKGGDKIGKVVEGDLKKLHGMQVDQDGDILDKVGNAIGKAERWEPEPEEEPEEEKDTTDYSVLRGGKVNKGGNVVNDDLKIIGRVRQGVLAHLVGKKCDENGDIWSDAGKIIGKAEPIPDEEREGSREPAPFESFPDNTVDADGWVVANGEKIGKVTSGDNKVLRGKKVDPDGDILDKAGNVIGKAERWEPEPEPEEKPVDNSILAGKRVNKAGNIVDKNGTIFGRLVEGDAKKLAGRMCDKNGNVLSESGDVIGKAEQVPEGEREGLKEGPFAELSGCTVTKEGKIVTPGGDVVGRLTSGDPKVLFGRTVDDDGDILDKSGNTIGKAERWEEPVVEKKKTPLAGRRVNKEGNVVDEDGNLIGKLTDGKLSICAGKEIDNDGDVIDGKGSTIGHVSLLEDIPEEPTETEEEKTKREELEKDKKLAAQLAGCLEQALDRVRPICKMITEKIDKAERTKKEDLDEEALVKEVKPLIEEGGRILQEANGMVRGLDPDGRIQANAKHKSATREASPEEYHLADVLKELTGTVATTIDSAKRKLDDMPHARKQLNPLWGLLNEPLFQILAAVGLLLSGVLNLVGRLLQGLGLGGIIDGLLGTLGLNRVLEGLGLGSVSESLTGKKSGGGGGGLLGGVLGKK